MKLRHLAASAAILIAVSGCATQGASTSTESDAPQQVASLEVDTPAQAASAQTESAQTESRQAASGQAESAQAVDVMPGGKTVEPVDAAGQAEADFDAFYGNPSNDEAGGGSTVAQIRDPWEKYNRQVHTFNNVIDRAVLRPVAKVYIRVVPAPVRNGVSNFFRNLGQPITVINALLQGKPEVAANATMRFAVNSTFGVGGIFDPASHIDIPTEQEDFGQTLGKWGWAKSRYVELPLFGPRTVRDVFGMLVDRPLNPTRRFDPEAQTGMSVLQVVDIRTQLLSVDSMREGAADDYLLYRDAWMQRRNYQIFGESQDGNESMPAYLLTAPVPMAEMAKPDPDAHKKKKKKSRRGVRRPPTY